jgi:hypothetical protein
MPIRRWEHVYALAVIDEFHPGRFAFSEGL